MFDNNAQTIPILMQAL